MKSQPGIRSAKWRFGALAAPGSMASVCAILVFLVSGFALTGGCANAQPFFVGGTLPGVINSGPDAAEVSTLLPVLRRQPLTAPLRFRIIVLPGSGCAGMGPIADRYFAGLLHAEVLVLQKPGTRLDAWPAPANCGAEFTASDALGQWRDQAVAALRADAQQQRELGAPLVPQWLVGVSEGVELLPSLAVEVPQLAGLVLLAHPGLDPQEAGGLQAQRIGQISAWNLLARAQESTLPDSTVLQGRSLRYWRDLWTWPLAQPLLDGPWTLLHAWGDADASIPPEAFEKFAASATHRKFAYCPLRMGGADHGLQTAERDGLQQLWHLLARQTAWQQQGGLDCAP